MRWRPSAPNDGFQIGFHAIGDRGARMALDAFAYALQKSNKKNLRFRIEHDQVIAPEDFKKYKDLGVIASVQPNHLLTDMNWAESHIGPDAQSTLIRGKNLKTTEFLWRLAPTILWSPSRRSAGFTRR